MLNKEIPFRPTLEGDFRVRFYDVASRIVEGTPAEEIEDIVRSEIDWVENICNYNLNQRKIYRAIWFLFRDLIRASWKACYRDGTLYMSLPSLDGEDPHISASKKPKEILRGWMSESRLERITYYTDFIQRMEKNNAEGYNICDLIADGVELSSRLKKAHDGEIAVSESVKPYLQLVVEDERDIFTNLKISDIWRYFRLTWSTPAETTPGRTMQYLIRDAAHPMHAVIGIISLENCAVQITDRDNFIGWNQRAYIDRILTLDDKSARDEFKLLLKYLEIGIAGIDYSDLCSDSTINNPSEDDVSKLLEIANSAEVRRQSLLKKAEKEGIANEDRSELGAISKDTEEALYERKRSEQLARLLGAKRNILKIYNSDSFDDEWRLFCKSEIGNSAIRNALVAQKTQHIGSSMMELNVCGAIPPYNEILGGKLAALLALSPQVIHDYKDRYSGKASTIASRLKGEKIYKKADLVYIGTTSLYYVGSSQYNRLKIPGGIFNSDYSVEWKKLGMTVGYGTMHISKATTMSLTEATSDGYNRINHVFGEGASPKMRLLATSIRELLEVSNADSADFSKHAMSRIVYGACLASNTQDYLMGRNDTPKYYSEIDDYQEGTQKIINYWISRWLASRLNYDPIYDRINAFDKKEFLVGNQNGKDKEYKFEKLKEAPKMSADDNNLTGMGVQSVRDFYRGINAYSDYVKEDLLSRMHINTTLDKAVEDSVKNGKDVVLTGDPGDGKTHIIRILKKKLDSFNAEIVIDASTLSNEEIYNKWSDARNRRVPFVIAINAAVLYYTHISYPEFKPIQDAYSQMSQSVTFHGESVAEDTSSVVVYDLSKRNILTENILKQAIKKMTSDRYYKECEKCPIRESCNAQKNRELLNGSLFQERLSIILKRVALQGYHATLRELQGFISYLIFADLTCEQLHKFTGNSEYDIVNLIYSGKGGLFDKIRDTFDPINISHPIWDEKILKNDLAGSWTEGYNVASETIEYDEEDLFKLRKRQFYFFNKNGDELLKINDDNVKKYDDFLNQDDNKIIKELIGKLDAFFENGKSSGGELRIWLGHRYDNEPRKVLISTSAIKRSGLSIGRPTLIASMQSGIEMMPNYVRLEKKDSTNIFLKIDYDMFLLLNEVEKGVPVLFMESDLIKKIWRFIEQLQSYDRDDEDYDIKLMDIQNKQIISVHIDEGDQPVYSRIKCEKSKGM